MNETLQTIHKRHTCRAYTGEVPPHDDLLAVAHAALAAPSGLNGQPWHVILVKDRALIGEMEAEGLAHVKADADQSTWERLKSRGGPVDTGIIAQTAALAAASLGIDNCICGMGGIAYAGARGMEFKRRVGFPEGYEHGMTLLLGYGVSPGEPHKLDYEKISIVESANGNVK